MLPSLLDFRPESYGLPPFEDTVCGVVPLYPAWRLKGPVVKGFGRGSRELGIPTANLEAVALQVWSTVAYVLGPLHTQRLSSIAWHPWFDAFSTGKLQTANTLSQPCTALAVLRQFLVYLKMQGSCD